MSERKIGLRHQDSTSVADMMSSAVVLVNISCTPYLQPTFVLGQMVIEDVSLLLVISTKKSLPA